MEYRGGQRQVLYLAEAQDTAGMDVLICAPCGAQILEQAQGLGLRTVVLPGRYDFDPRNLISLRSQRSKLTVLHTHDARAASLGAFASPWMNALVHTRRVSYPLGQGWSRLKYRCASIVVCVSREVEEAVHKARITRTSIISSAIKLSRYSPRGEGNDGRIGIIGALSPQKGHEQFFKALVFLKNIPEVWVVGTGALENELKELAKRLGIDHRISWMGYRESVEILPHLDTLVVPSAHGEGSSGVIKEGFASGVPVICSDLAANLELVTSGYNGLVFQNGDPEDLALKISDLEDERLRRQLIISARHEISRFDVKSMHDAYCKVYEEVI